jgi:hypothetical protein
MNGCHSSNVSQRGQRAIIFIIDLPILELCIFNWHVPPSASQFVKPLSLNDGTFMLKAHKYKWLFPNRHRSHNDKKKRGTQASRLSSSKIKTVRDRSADIYIKIIGSCIWNTWSPCPGRCYISHCASDYVIILCLISCWFQSSHCWPRKTQNCHIWIREDQSG